MSKSGQSFMARVEQHGLRQGPRLYSVVHSELARIATQHTASSHEPPADACLLADIGDFLIEILDLVSALAKGLVFEQYISDYCDHVMTEGSVDEEPSLITIDYIDDKCKALKDITESINETSDLLKEKWRETPETPDSLLSNGRRRSSSFLPIRSSTSTSLESNTAARGKLPQRSAVAAQSQSQSQSQPQRPPPAATAPSPSAGSDTSQAESSALYNDATEDSMPSAMHASSPSEEISTLLDQLNERGTGEYVCPKGQECQKGGRNSDGTMKVFYRNCDFKHHLERHQRRYKCDLPNCPNKGKGFARPDQLKRHQEIVKHKPKHHTR